MSQLRTSIVLFFLLTLSAWGGTYQVGVGDVLSVRVLGEKEFSGNFRIATDGSIDYPYLRKIDVQEKNVEELKALITVKLKDGYLSDPQVSVEVKEHHSQKVLVLGAVARPGPYVLKEESRILDILSQAGGLTAAGGKRIVLLRDQPDEKAKYEEEKTPEIAVEKTKTVEKAKKAELVVVDYYNLVHKGDFTQNLVLRNGDIVNVPRANEVLISGNVGKPGPIKYEDGMSLLQAITLAGDTTAIASPKNTYILRKAKNGENKLEVRLDKIKEGKLKDFPLKPDDIVVVPESFF